MWGQKTSEQFEDEQVSHGTAPSAPNILQEVHIQAAILIVFLGQTYHWKRPDQLVQPRKITYEGRFAKDSRFRSETLKQTVDTESQKNCLKRSGIG